MNTAVKSKFVELYKTEPLVIHSPGRINLIGEHTDYNSGYVMPAAINKGVQIALAASTYDRSLIYSIKYDQFVSVDLNHLNKSDSPVWVKYLLGVIDELQKKGIEISDFNCVVDGDLPTGAGLSSSAAMECGFAFAVNELFGLGLTKVELVQIAQAAENNFVGVKCGIMDQFASMMGKEDHVMLLDCRTLSYHYFPLEMGDYSLLLCDTNVKHSLASSEYNVRRKECEEGVAVLRAELPDVLSLRDVTPAILNKYKHLLSPIVFKRCQFVVEENARVLLASEDLRNGRLEGFGEKMFATHDGLSAQYEVSCAELDFVVGEAKRFDGVLGSRMMGGGFGGCTITILHDRVKTNFIKFVTASYRAAFGASLSCYLVKTANGTAIVENAKAPQHV